MSTQDKLAQALRDLLPMFAEWHEEFPRDIGDKEGPALAAARDALAAHESAQPAPAQQAGDWRTPTTLHQRMSDAVALLCAGRRPSDEAVRRWLDGTGEELQSFAACNGPSWAQGIGLLDAARVMADQPTEGAEHEGMLRDYEHLNCPVCGGSGHVDDVSGAPALQAPLTDEQIVELAQAEWGIDVNASYASERCFARAVERAHGIRQTGGEPWAQRVLRHALEAIEAGPNAGIVMNLEGIKQNIRALLAAHGIGQAGGEVQS